MNTNNLQLFVELFDFQLTTLLIVAVLFLLVYVFIKKVSAFVHLNKDLVLKKFKTFQKFLKINQHLIFGFFNVFLFLSALTVFPFWDVFLVFNFWGDFYLIFYILISLKFPIVEVVFFLIFILRLYFGLISPIYVYAGLCLVYFFFILESLNAFVSIRLFFSEIISDRKIFLSHQKDEFLNFFILEKQYVILLFFFLILPRIFREEFLNFVSTNESLSTYCDIILFFCYVSILINVLNNFIIIFICNPKMGAKGTMVNTCATCVVAVGTAVMAGDCIIDRAIGGIKEPGGNIVIRGVQRYNYQCEARTSADLCAVKDYINISNGRRTLNTSNEDS